MTEISPYAKKAQSHLSHNRPELKFLLALPNEKIAKYEMHVATIRKSSTLNDPIENLKKSFPKIEAPIIDVNNKGMILSAPYYLRMLKVYRLSTSAYVVGQHRSTAGLRFQVHGWEIVLPRRVEENVRSAVYRSHLPLRFRSLKANHEAPPPLLLLTSAHRSRDRPYGIRRLVQPPRKHSPNEPEQGCRTPGLRRQ